MLLQFKSFIISMFMSMPTFPDTNIDQVSCLAHATFYEASNQSMEGKLAVANVIVNRSESGKYPDDICKITKQKGQFSFWKNQKKINLNNDGVRDQVTDSVKAAMVALSDDRHDNTHGAVAFVNLKNATDTAWLNGMRRTVKIGSHTFYKFRSRSM